MELVPPASVSVVADGAATRRRLLDAAAAEFASFGLAGARVDRIADAAVANKAQIYAWFTNKDGLFDAVFAENLSTVVDLVPFDARDLPGYAVRLYDAYLDHPEIVLLATWARLERMPAGDLLAAAAADVDRKVAAIAAAQREGVVDPLLDPRDVHTMVIAVSLAWGPSSPTVTASRHDDTADHERRRDGLARVVGRAFAP